MKNENEIKKAIQLCQEEWKKANLQHNEENMTIYATKIRTLRWILNIDEKNILNC